MKKLITSETDITLYNRKWYCGTIYFLFSIPIWFREKIITQDEAYEIINKF